jgi:hypothetical protein
VGVEDAGGGPNQVGPRTIAALCAAVTAAAIITLSAAVLVLHSDVGRLQAQISSQNPGAIQEISCAALRGVRLRVEGHTARCGDRRTP